MVEALQFSDDGGFNVAAGITAFCRGFTRICISKQDGDSTLERFVVGGIIGIIVGVNKRGNLILENRQIRFFINDPPDMQRRSNVSIWSDLCWEVADNIETSSRRLYWYVNETDFFGTLSGRLTGT